ncbi:AAA family ATPase [Gluconobacter kanchanaburiensis]|uniref:YhaN AAA domain-containing protein n=1 Tax=Gluconobacter kanchanaburiensis NBRC 103587 TaxID=1307948 RepID=A0A511B534_9PROT|nr:AAA family ATPase [Gluconobacter kanchanaburiensis]MBF0861915.1 AAA family ATPase [Gluconobacter kanchanaburiensis]GBR67814.1 hypothetical protein AA103587_0480 [Gluconobacter kanchanaburiensis NBRC 103587]GEK95560.1 hypothetical protein GKA01_07570 [Gluconobacter kanchanaburiensis NBRC 103587]
MRFERLDLLRYGGFQDTTLAFPKGERDLHVIYGPNEAGKSTTLCAIRDFLFGFPHHISGDWRTAASLLRVGACLEQDGTLLEGIRRRGRSQTLFAPDDETPLDDLTLKTWLGGLDAKDFEAAWALDHARLREGGEDMRRLKDDAGLQLLAAGLGLEGIGRLSSSLEDEASAEWKFRSSKSGLKQAQTRLTELQKSLRNQTTTARQLSIATKELSLSETGKATCDEDSARLGVRRRENSRLKMTAVPYQKLRETEEEISRLPDHGLSMQECDRISETLENLRHEKQALSILNGKLAAVLKDSGAFGERHPVLADQDDIRALLARSTLVERLNAASADRETRMTRDGIWLEQFWARHGYEKGQEPGNLPEVSALDDLTRRLDARALLHAQETELRARIQDAERALETFVAAGEEGATAPVEPPTPDRLRLFRLEIEDARSLGPIDDRIDTLEEAVSRHENLTAEAYGALAPWRPKTTDRRGDLREIALPDSAVLEEECRFWASLDDQRRMALEDAQAGEETAAKLMLERRRLEEEGHAVSREQLSAARQERDRLWQVMENHSESGTCLPAEMRAAFGILVHNADSLADRRHAHAEQSAQLAALVRQEEDLSLRIQDAHRRAQHAAAELDRRKADWEKTLETLGLPVLPPALVQAWITRRQGALSAEDALHAERTQLHAAKASRDEMRRRLEVFVKTFTSDRLAVQIRQASSLLEHDEALAKRHETLATDRLRLEKTLTQDRTRLSELDRSQAQWNKDWSVACQACHYPGRPERVDVQDMREARTIRGRLESESREQASDAQDIASFKAALTVFLERYEQRDATELDAFLKRELTREQERQTVLQQRAALEDDILQSGLRLSALEAQLAPLRVRLGAPQDEDLRQALSGAQHRATLCNRRDELRTQILQAGQGRPLDALLEEARTTDPQRLEQDFEALEAETATLDARRSEVNERLFKARAALSELETARGVHDTAEEIQETEAEIAERANRYVSLRLQQMMLSRLVEQERQKTHGPLLSRAGNLFSRLTLGRYCGLATEEESTGGIMLAGRRPGNTALVPVNAMSEGTRDQLYLALRLASVEQALERGIRLPFLADDLFITFDEERTAAGLDILSEISKKTQVLFFTHHGYILNQSKLSSQTIEL